MMGFLMVLSISIIAIYQGMLFPKLKNKFVVNSNKCNLHWIRHCKRALRPIKRVGLKKLVVIIQLLEPNYDNIFGCFTK